MCLYETQFGGITLKIAVLGFGTVGVGVYEMIKMRNDMSVKYVLDIKKHEELGEVSVTDFNDILNDSEVDTVVEVIGGLNPAYGFLTSAMKAGKNVITANKFLVSTYYKELTNLAVENKVSFRYTAAAGGAIPWLVNLERAKRAAEITAVYGIMNGTSNFILDSMHTGSLSFDTALAEAQRLGYAERDPSNDIDGLDTLCKVVLSANIAFSVAIDKENADVEGIRDITEKDIEVCEEMKCVCRLMAYAKKIDNGISVYVEPAFISVDKPEATVKQNLNMISFDAQYVGRESFYGFGAGRFPTAYTVVEDCIDVANSNNLLYNNILIDAEPDNTLSSHCYYVRTDYTDSWFETVKAKQKKHGVITTEVSVSEMHKFAKKARENGFKCFIAGI